MPTRQQAKLIDKLTRELTASSRVVLDWLLAHREYKTSTLVRMNYARIASECNLSTRAIPDIMTVLVSAKCIQRMRYNRSFCWLNPYAWFVRTYWEQEELQIQELCEDWDKRDSVTTTGANARAHSLST